MRPFLPSWLVPGSWLPNAGIARSTGWAGGVELLLFSFEGADRELFLAEWPGIAALADKDFRLSVHLPDPLLPAHEEIIRLTRPALSSFVVHPPRGADGGAAEPPKLAEWRDLVEGWRERHGREFLLEYTDGRAFEAADEATGRSLPLCADTGRLLLENKDIGSWIAQREIRVAEIHLHGSDGEKDHRPLGGDEAWLRELSPFLAGFRGIVELEVFGLEGATASWTALQRLVGGPL